MILGTPRLRRPRFSLRSLLALIAVCALAAWSWSIYCDRPAARLSAALAQIERENPGADISFSRDADRSGLHVYVRNACRVSPQSAHALARASQIGYLYFRAGSVDGLLGDLDAGPEAISILTKAFFSVDQGSFQMTCMREFDPRDRGHQKLMLSRANARRGARP